MVHSQASNWRLEAKFTKRSLAERFFKTSRWCMKEERVPSRFPDPKSIFSKSSIKSVIGHPKTLVSGGLKLPQCAAAKKEIVNAALTGIMAGAFDAR
jgi:hypothetical protein